MRGREGEREREIIGTNHHFGIISDWTTLGFPPFGTASTHHDDEDGHCLAQILHIICIPEYPPVYNE